MRCFIAVPCPEGIRKKLVEVQNQIRDFGKIKMVEFENIHLTLKFLGEVSEEKIERISNELDFLNEKKKFDLKVKGLGVFPKLSHINVVWAGVEDGRQITEIQSGVDDRLGRIGFPLEEKFHPHYTIARVKYLDDKESLKKFILDEREREFGSYAVESIRLMSSVLNQKGPAYSTLKEYRLF